MGRRGGAGDYTSDDYRALTMELLDMRQDTCHILCSWTIFFMHVRAKETGTHWHPPYTNRICDLQPFEGKENSAVQLMRVLCVCVCVHRTVKSLK
jgi:hypothetical protein